MPTKMNKGDQMLNNGLAFLKTVGDLEEFIYLKLTKCINIEIAPHITSQIFYGIIIKDILKKIIEAKKKIWVLYEEKEYNIDKILEQRFGDKIKKKEVSTEKRKEACEQFICFYPNVLVEFVEKTEKVFDKPITIFEGRIEFDSDVIKSKMAHIIKDYEISFTLPKSASPENKQKKYSKDEKIGVTRSYKKYRRRKENK